MSESQKRACEIVVVHIGDDARATRIMEHVERLRRMSNEGMGAPAAIVVKELRANGDAPKEANMDNTGFIRALAEGEKLNAARDEILISRHARNRLVHMSMHARIRVRSLIAKGMKEDDAIDVVRGRGPAKRTYTIIGDKKGNR